MECVIWQNVRDCKDKDMVNSPPHYNKYGVECIKLFNQLQEKALSIICRVILLSIFGDTDIRMVCRI